MHASCFTKHQRFPASSWRASNCRVCPSLGTDEPGATCWRGCYGGPGLARGRPVVSLRSLHRPVVGSAPLRGERWTDRPSRPRQRAEPASARVRARDGARGGADDHSPAPHASARAADRRHYRLHRQGHRWIVLSFLGLGAAAGDRLGLLTGAQELLFTPRHGLVAGPPDLQSVLAFNVFDVLSDACLDALIRSRVIRITYVNSSTLIATVAHGPSLLRRIGSRALDLLLPPRCLACGIEIDAPNGLCPDCWSGLRLLAPPWCRCCGFPLPHASVDAPLCAGCAAEPPAFDRGARRTALRRQQQPAHSCASSVVAGWTASPCSRAGWLRPARSCWPTPT